MATEWTEWTSETILEFLELYRLEPCLYDPQNPHYRNKQKHNEAWTRVQQAMKIEHGTIVSIPDMKKKKESLMSAFRLNKKKASTRVSDVPGEEFVKPSWFAYDSMDAFLGQIYGCDPVDLNKMWDNPQENSGHLSDSFDMAPEVSVQDDRSSDEWPVLLRVESRQYIPPQVQSKRVLKPLTQKRPAVKHEAAVSPQENNQDEELKIMEQAFGILQELRRKEDDDDCDLYGRLIAKKIRRFLEVDRPKVMYEIDGLILKMMLAKNLLHDNHSY